MNVKIKITVIFIILFVFIYLIPAPTKTIESYTNKEAHYYNKVWMHKDEISNQFNKGKKDIAKILNKKGENANVLFIGVGTGSYMKYMEALFPKANYFGIDTDHNMVKKARVKNPVSTIKQGNALDKSEYSIVQFDVILLCRETIHHFEPSDLPLLFNNIFYWLQSNGLLIVDIFEANKLDSGPENHSLMKKNIEGNNVGRTFYDNFFHTAVYSPWEEKGEHAYMLEENVRTKSGFISIETLLFVLPLKNTINTIRDANFKLIKTDELPETNTLDFKVYYFKKK
jgi:SAM-dependent methyltransferase